MNKYMALCLGLTEAVKTKATQLGNQELVMTDNCGSDEESYTIYMHDSWGDGWHGNMLTIDG